jgi:hypothetical protein
MAKRKQSRDQQTAQEDAIVQQLLAAWHTIEERRPCATRWHMLMHQHFQLEIPVHYERLVRRAPPRPKESTYDHRRGSHQSRRRRLSRSRG